MPYRARESTNLLEALEGMFAGRSRKDLRKLLHSGRVQVNGREVTDPRLRVAKGDAIECTRQGKPAEVHPRVRILFEDEHLIVVDKGAGIMTSGGIERREPTVEQVLEKYLAARGIRRPVVPCHRLDRDVSGILLFAKSRRLAELVRGDPERYLAERVYHALVEGVPTELEGTLRGYLKDGVDKVVRPASGPEEGKLCVTHYRVIEGGSSHSALEVRLETGRKNQIRVQLAQMGHPIAGDAKYGAEADPAGRVALHAMKLVVIHPATGERLEFSSPPPRAIRRPR